MPNRILAAILCIMILSGCSASVRFSDNKNLPAKANPKVSTSTDKKEIETDSRLGDVYQSGYASYYGDGFDGRATASGDIFDKTKRTAAHRSLPFGTVVSVTNLKNGLTVKVIITDRGPAKQERIIDLSEAAAGDLDMLRDGVVPVEIRIIK